MYIIGAANTAAPNLIKIFTFELSNVASYKLLIIFSAQSACSYCYGLHVAISYVALAFVATTAATPI
jgi:hypothetical protein